MTDLEGTAPILSPEQVGAMVAHAGSAVTYDDFHAVARNLERVANAYFAVREANGVLNVAVDETTRQALREVEAASSEMARMHRRGFEWGYGPAGDKVRLCGTSFAAQGCAREKGHSVFRRQLYAGPWERA